MVRPGTTIGLARPATLTLPGVAVTVYPVIDAPPVNTGAVNATVAWRSPAVAVPIVGAAGTTALTLNERLTCGAAKYDALPDWSALMVQVPTLTNVNAPPLVMVQTAVVADVNVTVNPESALALNVGVVPKFCAPGLLKMMVCAAVGVTLFDAAEAEPVPAELVAVTVNEYATPLVRPVTVRGLERPVPVAPPGFAVTV